MTLAVALPRDAPVQCCWCGKARRFRRGLCRVCYRKHKESGVPLPPAAVPAKPGRAPMSMAERLRAWLRAMPQAQRALLRAALEDVA